jgi:hypothetical protein
MFPSALTLEGVLAPVPDEPLAAFSSAAGSVGLEEAVGKEGACESDEEALGE